MNTNREEMVHGKHERHEKEQSSPFVTVQKQEKHLLDEGSVHPIQKRSTEAIRTSNTEWFVLSSNGTGLTGFFLAFTAVGWRNRESAYQSHKKT